MPIPFDKYNWLRVYDLERCPYPYFTSHYPPTPPNPEVVKWIQEDDARMLLCALERYAEHIITSAIIKKDKLYLSYEDVEKLKLPEDTLRILREGSWDTDEVFYKHLNKK